MGDATVHAYNGRGGLIIGVLEIAFGIQAMFFQIPLYTEDVSIAVGSTGVWAGLYYIIVGIVTLLAGLRRQRSLVKASLGLSVFGLVIAIAAVTVACISLILADFHTVSGYGDTYEHAVETANWANGLIITLSFVMFFIFFASSILSCSGLKCCDCCGKEPEKMETF